MTDQKEPVAVMAANAFLSRYEKEKDNDFATCTYCYVHGLVVPLLSYIRTLTRQLADMEAGYLKYRGAFEHEVGECKKLRAECERLREAMRDIYHKCDPPSTQQHEREHALAVEIPDIIEQLEANAPPAPVVVEGVVGHVYNTNIPDDQFSDATITFNRSGCDEAELPFVKGDKVTVTRTLRKVVADDET